MTKIYVKLSSGPIMKVNMTSGARGLSAYDIWLSLGNIGSEEDFLDSISGSGGTSNYELLRNKPSIGDVPLIGDKTLEELGAVRIEENEISNLL